MITVAEADTYFASILNNSAWTAASADEKTRAIAEAIRIINTLRFKGEKTSDTQTDEWPRGEDGHLPQDILDACAEIAQGLLDGFEPDRERENLSIVSHSHNSSKTVQDKAYREAYKIAGVPSIKAWNLLVPYLAADLNIEINRA